MSIAFELIKKQYTKKGTAGTETIFTDIFNSKPKNNSNYLDMAYDRFQKINGNHIADYELDDSTFKDTFFQKSTPKNSVPKVDIQEIKVNGINQLSKKFKIAFANTEVEEVNIISSIRGKANLSSDRYNKLAKIVKTARLDKSDILLFPEFFIPINLLSSIVKYSEKNEVLIITGLEHVKIKNIVFNFIVTILPFELNGVKDATVVFRLKNHYAPHEKLLIKGNHLKVAKPIKYQYNLFNWKNLYLSPYYCFELADAVHRTLFKSKLDLLVGVEWNKDTNYFSNIVESTSRDLHCFIAQVNTCQYGDSRLTQPVESARKDILRLKGGKNDAVLVAEIDVERIREFQRKTFEITSRNNEFKPLPPDYEVDFLIKRINNESMM